MEAFISRTVLRKNIGGKIMVKTEYTDFRQATVIDAKYHLEKALVDLHVQTNGKNLLVVTIPLHELERLYRNIDQECRTGCEPFAPVTGK